MLQVVYLTSLPPLGATPHHTTPQAELAGLKKQLGLSAGDANHARFQTTAGGSGLSLSEYFEWAEVRQTWGNSLSSDAVSQSTTRLCGLVRFFYLLWVEERSSYRPAAAEIGVVLCD